MAKKKIEERVADTILQRDITVSAGGRSFTVPAPTLGTLIMVSERIADIPYLGAEKNAAVILANARQGHAIAEVLAIYILGAKAIKEDVNAPKKRLPFLSKGNTPKSKLEELTEDIELSMTPGDMNALYAQLIEATDFSDFFEVSTFLREASLTRPTKVETTASGQS